jgi:hypothetical protein
MKSFALAAVFAIAIVSAEKAYECKNPTDKAWTKNEDKTVTDAVTSATCESACKALATKDDASKKLDHCCMFIATEAVAKDDAADPKVAGSDATNVCSLLELATVADATIKSAKADAAGPPKVTCEAWAWNAGVAAADMAGADAAADSATMISSAIATIAAIAMVAY